MGRRPGTDEMETSAPVARAAARLRGEAEPSVRALFGLAAERKRPKQGSISMEEPVWQRKRFVKTYTAMDMMES